MRTLRITVTGPEDQIKPSCWVAGQARYTAGDVMRIFDMIDQGRGVGNLVFAVEEVVYQHENPEVD